MTEDDPIFVDTNVLLYALDDREPEKQASARAWIDRLWSTGAGRLSWQVLNESYSVAVRKLHAPARLARAAIETYAEWGIAELNLSIVKRAWHWIDRADVTYWDALILAAAESANCRYLLSEDFQDGRTYGSVKVVNPFHYDPANFIIH